MIVSPMFAQSDIYAARWIHEYAMYSEGLGYLKRVVRKKTMRIREVRVSSVQSSQRGEKREKANDEKK